MKTIKKEEEIKKLIDKLNYLKENEIKEIKKTAEYIIKKHEGQIRKSGEPYYIHPIEAAIILANLKLDKISIISALLHDIVEDTDTPLEEIKNLFGEKVAEIVNGVTKIGKYHFKSKEEAEAENFRKMIVSMANDIRVILVKLADRLHNARTFEYLPKNKQKEKAKETLEIYAPLAARLGLWKIKGELEDISFKYLYPEEYKKITTYLAQSKETQERYLKEKVVPIIGEQLKKHNIKFDIQYRSKHLYSIYEKTLRKGIKLSDIYDIYGIRILVEDVKDCYLTLGLIHSMFKPVPGRFKDYISLPKSNLYQALHTTIVGPEGKFVEIQIKTFKMHKIAEEGIAAHWRYKGGENLTEKDMQSFLWLRNILDSLKENSSTELIDNVRQDLNNDEIFVFTPKGDLVKLPVGATPVDFAYNIHTQIGHKCSGAKVNGRLVPLNTKLKNGDVVEIITSPNKKPNRDWLNFVVSSKAKTNIKSYLNKVERKRSIKFGEKLLDKLLRRSGKSINSLLEEDKNKLIERYNYKTFEDFLAALGDGKISLTKVLSFFKSGNKKQIKQKENKKGDINDTTIEVDGISNIMCSIANCCKPIPGDEIVGLITKGKGITIHLKDCLNAKNILEKEPEKKVDICWRPDISNATYSVSLRVISDDRPGLLAEVSAAIASQKSNISKATIRTRSDGKAINDFIITIKNKKHLDSILNAVKSIKGVESAFRLQNKK